MRKESKNRNIAEANRLAEMEYMKGREEMGIPSNHLEESPIEELAHEDAPIEEDDVLNNESDKEISEEDTVETNENLSEEINEIKAITKRLLGE